MNKKENYTCVMFPYPSGNALHIGHTYNLLSDNIKK
jgi:leucyl-tRNA synthetase